VTDERDTARAGLAAAERERDALSQRLAELSEDRDELRVRLTGAAREHDQLVARLADAQDAATTARRDAERSRWERDAGQAELVRVREEIDNGNSARAALVEQVAVLRGELAAARAELAAATGHTAHLTSQVTALTAALAQPRKPVEDNSLA
jgi:chromosome segregation ATPase